MSSATSDPHQQVTRTRAQPVRRAPQFQRRISSRRPYHQQPLSLANHYQPHSLAFHSATVIGTSQSATTIGTLSPARPGIMQGSSYYSLFHYPTGTIGSSGADRRPRGSSCTASQKTIGYGIIKPRDGIIEEHHQHHQVAGRHLTRPSRTASTKSIRQKALSRRGYEAVRPPTTRGQCATEVSKEYEHPGKTPFSTRSSARPKWNRRPHEPNSPTLDGRKGFTV